MSRRRLTKRAVDAGKPGTVLWDADAVGFGCRVLQSGARQFFVKYRSAGRQRWFTIGRNGAPWTVETARREARRILGAVASGEDPSATKSIARADRTVADLCDEYLEAIPTLVIRKSGRPKKASTIATDRGRIERHIKPLLGRMKVRAVTSSDIERFLADVTAGRTAADVRTRPRGRAIVRGGEGTASRTVGLLGGIFSYAIKTKLRADNPVQGVQRYRDNSSERFPTPEELTRLGRALAEAEKAGENQKAIAALRLLALTGCRKTEILSLEWQSIDFERSYFVLPDSKTGRRVVRIGAAALSVLADIPRMANSPFVFPGERLDRFYVGLPKVWKRIRERAGLNDLRLHDLRHGFASFAAAGGDSLLVIGALLGHRDVATTRRYAHLVDDVLQASADRVSGRISAALDGKTSEVRRLNRT